MTDAEKKLIDAALAWSLRHFPAGLNSFERNTDEAIELVKASEEVQRERTTPEAIAQEEEAFREYFRGRAKFMKRKNKLEGRMWSDIWDRIEKEVEKEFEKE
jgi:hypothetical protein